MSPPPGCQCDDPKNSEIITTQEDLRLYKHPSHGTCVVTP
ncbi:hypothetical protein VP01_1276g10 [Puccinia sorghi]|uniref:Uncharacterized protein n=1 Tax=Puccinia sorghi TaxID=27349 RepID=A0A0L6VNU9_9BASI|nr:hypothetical protein VP01_1276g10 [Puccinia sorghi]